MTEHDDEEKEFVMKIKFLFTAACAAILLITACTPAATETAAPTSAAESATNVQPTEASEPAQEAAKTEPSPNGLHVLASTTFLADITRNISGDRAEVEALLPIGADPHGYQAVPSDVAKIAESNVLILNGVDYEHFIEPLLENAGGERVVVEASTGLDVMQMAEEEGEDHSPEAHAVELCEQLDGKSVEHEVTAGLETASAVELHSHSDEGTVEEEHEHEREITTVKLTSQSDGTFAGYLLFDSEEEQGYAFSSPAGTIAVLDKDGNALEVGQNLAIDCSGMTVGQVYQLPVGEYVVYLSGYSAESIPFSGAPMHAHTHEGEEGHTHNHEAGDPHMWLDPTRVITYVENIRAGLTEADPAGADVYQANADAYAAQLTELDQWISEQVKSIPAEKRMLVTNHEALGYFAARYGFEVIGAVIPSLSTEASPSAQQMAELVEQINSVHAPAIFLGEAENPNLAHQIAEETGLQVVDDLYLETLTDGDPAPTYIEMMKYDVSRMVEVLK
jgi:manganese/iron transport system substrate-binding protein